MNGRTASGKRELWRRRVNAQSSSGLSVAAYCRRESISEASFYYWKRKSAGDSPHRRPRAEERSAGFVQLPLTAPIQASRWVEITALDGVAVRVPADCDAALETSLRVLTQIQLGRREVQDRA